uniref:Uncharacterized protein n=1 Tax=Rhizophora mucronata TaxID=61149 RepID=A0A2P2NRI6_RHIMU
MVLVFRLRAEDYNVHTNDIGLLRSLLNNSLHVAAS